MPEPTPLSARSVVLSLVLGAHPRALGAAGLTRTGDHFGIVGSTVRVALTRAVAAGDLERDGSDYRLGPRLLERRRRQEDHDALVAWDGTWEMAVVVGAGRPSGARAALRVTRARARLAELREGVWTRPANLGRTGPTTDTGVLLTLRATPDADPAALAAGLWDLPAWTSQALAILDDLASTTEPAPRLAIAAHLVRHLATDPLLPPELCPAWWPAERAHGAYAAYQGELRAILDT